MLGPNWSSATADMAGLCPPTANVPEHARPNRAGPGLQSRISPQASPTAGGSLRLGRRARWSDAGAQGPRGHAGVRVAGRESAAAKRGWPPGLSQNRASPATPDVSAGQSAARDVSPSCGVNGVAFSTCFMVSWSEASLGRSPTSHLAAAKGRRCPPWTRSWPSSGACPPSVPATCQGHAQGPRPGGHSHRPLVPPHVGDPSGTPHTPGGEECPRGTVQSPTLLRAVAQGLRSAGRGGRPDPEPGTARCSQAPGHRPEPQVSRRSSGAGCDGVWAGTALVPSSVPHGMWPHRSEPRALWGTPHRHNLTWAVVAVICPRSP